MTDKKKAAKAATSKELGRKVSALSTQNPIAWPHLDGARAALAAAKPDKKKAAAHLELAARLAGGHRDACRGLAAELAK